jgi:molybdopterin converting factor small subunit
LARVVLRDQLRRHCGVDAAELNIEASDLRRLIKALDERFPGAAEMLNQSGVAVAIDGVIYNQPLAEKLGPDSEVCFIPALRGG